MAATTWWLDRAIPIIFNNPNRTPKNNPIRLTNGWFIPGYGHKLLSFTVLHFFEVALAHRLKRTHGPQLTHCFFSRLGRAPERFCPARFHPLEFGEGQAAREAIMKAIYQCLPRKDLQKHVENKHGASRPDHDKRWIFPNYVICPDGYYENSDLASWHTELSRKLPKVCFSSWFAGQPWAKAHRSRPEGLALGPTAIIQAILRRTTEPKVSVKYITHRIHGAGIYANIWGILMVNVTIYSIHGSYG